MTSYCIINPCPFRVPERVFAEVVATEYRTQTSRRSATKSIRLARARSAASSAARPDKLRRLRPSLSDAPWATRAPVYYCLCARVPPHCTVPLQPIASAVSRNAPIPIKALTTSILFATVPRSSGVRPDCVRGSSQAPAAASCLAESWRPSAQTNWSDVSPAVCSCIY
jgi:hypothetical protein